MELKPCPFCGSNDLIQNDYHIVCSNCRCLPTIDRSNIRASQWISVKDNLPKESGYYLCTYHFDGHNFYQDKWFSSLDNSFSTTDCVTHWQPLPEPPNG